MARADRATFLALLALRPLGSRLLLEGHDADRYVPRTVEFHESVKARALPPVWAAHLSAGHGQPLFEFAPPLLYALGEPLYALGLGIAPAIQLPVFAAFLAGALALSALARRLAGRAAGFLAPIAFLYAPYVQIDLYVRTAWSEALALGLAPCVLLAVLHAVESPGRASILALGAATAAVALAHPPGFLMTMGVGAALALALVAARGTWRSLLPCAAGVLLGLGLSAFSWLPAYLERGYTKTYLLVQGDLHYSQHFLEPRQLLWGPWGFGYSVPGPDDQMPFYVGPVHLLLAAIGLVVAFRERDRRLRAVGLMALLATLVALGLTLAPSAPVWERLPMLQNFAYPWRLLAVPALLLSLLAGFAARSLKGAWVLVPVALVVSANISHADAWGRRRVGPNESIPEGIARNNVRTSYYEEYEPRSAPRDAAYQPYRLESKTPITSAELLEDGPERQVFAVDAPRGARITLRTYAYPGWTVTDGAWEIPSWAEPFTGRISFDLAPGSHRLTVELRPTFVRRAASLCSALTLLLLAALGLHGRVRAWSARGRALPGPGD